MSNLKMKLEQAEDRCSKAENEYAKFNRQSIEVTNFLLFLCCSCITVYDIYNIYIYILIYIYIYIYIYISISNMSYNKYA